MRTLSDLALRAQNAEHSDEVWLVLLTIDHADIVDGPLLFVNDRHNLRISPTNIIAEPSLADWTGSGSLAMEAVGSAFRLTDPNASGGSALDVTTGSLSAGLNYTSFVRVMKDAVGKADRVFAFNIDHLGADITRVTLDTATGDYLVETTGAAATAAGVLDDGNAWLVYITRTGATSHRATLWPAFGMTNLGAAGLNVAATGSVVVDRPVLYQGLIGDLDEYIAFPFTLDLPGEDPDAPSVARLRIDNVDRQIVEAVRGLPNGPTASLEVVLASQPETIEIGFYDLTIRAVNYDAFVVEANMTYEQIFTEPCSLEMTPARFPGLF